MGTVFGSNEFWLPFFPCSSRPFVTRGFLGLGFYTRIRILIYIYFTSYIFKPHLYNDNQRLLSDSSGKTVGVVAGVGNIGRFYGHSEAPKQFDYISSESRAQVQVRTTDETEAHDRDCGAPKHGPMGPTPPYPGRRSNLISKCPLRYGYRPTGPPQFV